MQNVCILSETPAIRPRMWMKVKCFSAESSFPSVFKGRRAGNWAAFYFPSCYRSHAPAAGELNTQTGEAVSEPKPKAGAQAVWVNMQFNDSVYFKYSILDYWKYLLLELCVSSGCSEHCWSEWRCPVAMGVTWLAATCDSFVLLNKALLVTVGHPSVKGLKALLWSSLLYCTEVYIELDDKP